MDRLDYIEREAQANMEFHLENLDSLKSEAQATLNFLLLILSGAFGYTIKLLGDDKLAWAFVMGCVTSYLSCVAGYLTLYCLATGVVMPPTNEPRNLSSNDCSLEELRELELKNLQKRIVFNRKRNTKIGRRLNKARLLVCASPVVFLLAWFLLFAIGHSLGWQTF